MPAGSSLAPVIALGLLACVLAGACGGSSSPAPSPTPSPSSSAAASSAAPTPAGRAGTDRAAPDPCTLLGPEAAAAAVAAPVGPAQHVEATAGATCLYASAGAGPGVVSLTVAATPGGSGALASVAQNAPDATTAPGLGRQVLIAHGAAWMLRDGRLLSIVVLAPGGGPGSTEAAARLVRTIAAAP